MAGPTLTVSTPLGPGAVSITSLTAQEEISTPFDFSLELGIANGQAGVFDKLLNQTITVTLSDPNAGTRFFTGICTQLTEAAQTPTGITFLADVTPFFWSQARNRNSRIFQNISVPDILKRVFPNNTRFALANTYPVRNYCVQYRESDFAFASRLMEEEGIYYYFEHTASKHTMVLADRSSGAVLAPGPTTVPFGQPAPGVVYTWLKAQQLTAGRATVSDFNFQIPTTNLLRSKNISTPVQVGAVSHDLNIGNNGLEQFDFPGGFAKWFDSNAAQNAPAQAARLATLRMQEVAAGAVLINGGSGCPGFTPGYKITLTGHPDGNGDYLLRQASHTATQSPGSPVQYSNTFTCIPITLPFRPNRLTPRPTIPGLQSAFVVGPAGQPTYSDKYGRVKVQFFWDRVGKSDANSSCWVRVAAMLPGDVTIPPIGREVLVAFEEGDPDRPIIVGSAHSPGFP